MKLLLFVLLLGLGYWLSQDLHWLACFRGWYPHWRAELRSWSTDATVLWLIVAIVFSAAVVRKGGRA